LRARLAAIAVWGITLALAGIGAAQADPTGSVQAKWYAQAVINMSLTPNYASGFGAVKATFGTQPAPVAGPNASLNGGSVDFGSIISGNTYLYKYAAHLHITSNDTNGVAVYGEGAADFFNTNDSTSQALNQTLFYLPSTASGDANTGFSASLPFNRTTGAVSGGAYGTPASISYSTFPAPITNTLTANSDLYYDYQLKVPVTATGGLYYVWVVYTVVPL
jgi:hypothetical protein